MHKRKAMAASPSLTDRKAQESLISDRFLVTRALPDELARGHLGRIRAINLQPDSEKAAKALIALIQKDRELPKKAHRVIAMATASGLSLEQYCQQHTFIPFLRTATKIGPGIPHGSLTQVGLIETLAFRLCSPARLACRECIAEDLESRGFAYWRRQHQIPGVISCDRHGTLLFQPNESFDHCPAPLAADTVSALHPSEDLRGNPFLERYCEVARGLMNSPHPITHPQAAERFSSRARELGLRVGQSGRGKYLSDLAVQIAPHKWLATLLPGIERKKPGQYFPMLDRIVHLSGRPQYRALALALLFDSSEEALAHWNAPAAMGIDSPAKQTIRVLDYWNGRLVFGLYGKSGRNRAAVGPVLSVSYWSPTLDLGRTGLPSFTGADLERTGAALEAYYNGQPLAAACARHSAPHDLCEELIRKAGTRFAKALSRIRNRAPLSDQVADLEGNSAALLAAAA